MASGYSLANNGRFIELHHPPGNFIAVRDHKYELKTLSVHTPSEHIIGGVRAGLELQLHHQDDYGNMASVALLFKTVDKISDTFYQRYTANHFWNGALPSSNGTLTGGYLDLSHYVPQTKEENHYYVYKGSMTHPPCTEGVQWFIMKDPHEITQQEVDKIVKVTGGVTSRPIQATLGRDFQYF